MKNAKKARFFRGKREDFTKKESNAVMVSLKKEK